jgi:hypothetical protein
MAGHCKGLDGGDGGGDGSLRLVELGYQNESTAESNCTSVRYVRYGWLRAVTSLMMGWFLYILGCDLDGLVSSESELGFICLKCVETFFFCCSSPSSVGGRSMYDSR